MYKDGLITAEEMADGLETTIERLNWCYIDPPETITKGHVYFAVCQVSKHRHIVMKYAGQVYDPEHNKSEDFRVRSLEFEALSEPLKYEEAQALVNELRKAREDYLLALDILKKAKAAR